MRIAGAARSGRFLAGAYSTQASIHRVAIGT